MLRVLAILPLLLISSTTLSAGSPAPSLAPESATPAAPRPAQDRPNVVVFLLDDAGYGDFEHNGNPTISTPRIAQIAQGGANFMQCYVASPACSASRYSLLTGRVPGRSGLGHWVVGPEAARYIHPKEITLADGLHNAGYATGMFGKWHLGSPNPANKFAQDSLPLAHGFDQWIGTNVSHDYANAMLLQSDPAGHDPVAGYRVLARNLPSDRAVTDSLTERYTRAATDFIHANRGKPFFAYVALNQPHLGLFCGKEFKGTSRRGLLGDVMAEADHSLGAILDALKAEGIAGNTLVIFTSDNGPWLRYMSVSNDPRHGDTRLDVGYAHPFRNGKGSNWEGGLRVPGIFYWPGVIPPARIREPVSTLDILPTVFRLTGAAMPDKRTIDGRDIRPLISSRWSGSVPAFDFLYPDENNHPLGLRQGPWKLMTGITQQYRDEGTKFAASIKKPLLFQVEQDLSERIDRAAEHRDIVEAMRKALQERERQIQAEGSFWKTSDKAQKAPAKDKTDEEPMP